VAGEALQVEIEFKHGIAIAVNSKADRGCGNRTTLNRGIRALRHRRGLASSDTTIGLKGRVCLKAPALTALHVAHRARRNALLTKSQNLRFQARGPGAKWTETGSPGFSTIRSSTIWRHFSLRNQRMSQQHGYIGNARGAEIDACRAVAPHLLQTAKATYAAAAADWGVSAEARRFIRLYGQKLRRGPK
jgi:argininosuccinate synthase